MHVGPGQDTAKKCARPHAHTRIVMICDTVSGQCIVAIQ